MPLVARMMALILLTQAAPAAATEQTCESNFASLVSGNRSVVTGPSSEAERVVAELIRLKLMIERLRSNGSRDQARLLYRDFVEAVSEARRKKIDLSLLDSRIDEARQNSSVPTAETVQEKLPLDLSWTFLTEVKPIGKQFVDAQFFPTLSTTALIINQWREAELLDLETNDVQPFLKLSYRHPPTFSPNGQFIVGTKSDSTPLTVWEVSSGKEIVQAGADTVNAATHCTFSPDNAWLAISTIQGKVDLLPVNAGGQKRVSFRAHHDEVTSLAFSPDGSFFVTSSDDKTVKVWDMKTQTELRSFSHMNAVKYVEVSKDGRVILTRTKEGEVFLWDARTGAQLRKLKGVAGRYGTSVFSRDGKFVLVWLALEKTVHVWNAETGDLEFEVGGHSDRMTHATFSPDGAFIITSSYDGTAIISDAKSGIPLGDPINVGGSVLKASMSANGRYLVLRTDSGLVFWKRATP